MGVLSDYNFRGNRRRFRPGMTDLTQNRLRRGVFRDVEELMMAIGDYIDRHNENPRPFIWTSKATDILADP